MPRTWEEHSFAIAARKCHAVQLSVPAAHTLRWQFCVEGIAVDIGLCVQVLEQPSATDCSREQSEDSVRERTCGQASVDEDEDCAGESPAATADVPWHGLKATRPRAAVLRRLTGMTGDRAGAHNSAAPAASGCGRDGAGNAVHDALSPKRASKRGTAADPGDPSNALLGLCANDWLLAEEFCTMGLDRFGSGHAVSGAWHCSATRCANATLVLLFNNAHSRLRPKKVKLYTCQLLTEDALAQMEEESRCRAGHRAVAGGADAEAGAEQATTAQQCMFRGELKVEVIRARRLGQLDQANSRAPGDHDSRRTAAARQSPPPDVPAGDGVSLGLLQSIGTAVSSAIGNSVDAVVDRARSLSSTGINDRGTGAANPTKVVMDWRGSAAGSDSTSLPAVEAPAGASVEADVGGVDQDAKDQSPAASSSGQAELAAQHASADDSGIVPSAPYVCAYAVPSGTASCPSRTGICRGGNTEPCWRGVVACNELTLHVTEGDTAIRVQLWESHRLYFDELIGEVEISLRMFEDDATKDQKSHPKMFELARAAWHNLGGKVAGDLMLAFHRVLPPDVEKIMVESLTCNKCGKIIRQAAGEESLMAAVEAHLALCSAARKAEREADALREDSTNTTRSLRVTVHRALLQDVQVFGVQSPYVAVASLPSRSSKASTLSVEGGGTKPRWDGGDKNCMVLDVCEADTAIILEVQNAGVMMDDAIGTVEVNLSSLVSPLEEDLPTDVVQASRICAGSRVWLDLVPEGRLQCSIEWVVDFADVGYNFHDDHEIAESRSNATASSTPCFQRLPQLVTPLVIAQGSTERSFRSRVLTRLLASNLEEELPIQFRGYDWHLLYSMTLQGCDMSSFFRHVRGHSPSIIVAKTCAGDMLGGFVTQAWKNYGAYHGTSDSFVFSTHPKFAVYHPKALELDEEVVQVAAKDDSAPEKTRGIPNHCFQIGFERAIAMGGGGTFAFCMGADFLECSTGMCDTFGSPALAQTELFECADVEVWGLRPPEFSREDASRSLFASESPTSTEIADEDMQAEPLSRLERAATLVPNGASSAEEGGSRLKRKPTVWF